MQMLRERSSVNTDSPDIVSSVAGRLSGEMARKHLDEIRRAVRRSAVADAHVGDAMLAAKESGETIGDICAAAGMGRTKAYELIRQARERRQT
jgi:hypothetical protein